MATRVGMSVKTLPTVKPKLYAGKVGTVATKNDGELGVLVNGRVVWFLEKEIEEWQSQSQGFTQPPSTHSRGSGSRIAPAVGSASNGTRQNTRAETELATRTEPPDCPVTNPPSHDPGPSAPSEPRPPSAAPRGAGDLSGFNPGERGPGGGIVAKCEECGVLWERPKQRGRPARMCEGCR